MRGWRPLNRIVICAEPSASPVSLAEAKAHLRVDYPDEDGVITGMIAQAVDFVERHTQRLLTQRQVVLRLPGLPLGICPVELPGGHVSAVASVVADGAPVTGATAVGHSPALLIPAGEWPTVSASGYPVTITYTAGYDTVPPALIGAVLLHLETVFTTRGDASGDIIHAAAVTSQALRAPFRIRPVG